ncbi:hypothetical protein APHAL10511_003850, partial [Amanita phalloides]
MFRRRSICSKPKLLDPSTVPNTLLAKISDRHHIRIFFPGLSTGERQSSALTAEESSAVYEIGILPALREVAPTIVHNFPPTYNAEGFRATLATGTQIQSTYPISASDVLPFSRALRAHMSAIPWGNDIIFGTEMRGVKNWTEHLPSEDEAENELFELFRKFSPLGHHVEDGDWYVDVAVELLHQNKAVVWRADCFRPIMQELLGFSEHETNRAVTNQRTFEQDISQHLTQVAGFRARCKKPTGPYEVLYIQAYTTDKVLTYQPEGGNFGKTLKGYHAIEGGAEGPSYTSRLLRSYEEARDKTDVAARLEVRVPLQQATSVLLNFPMEVYLQTCLVFPRELWNVRIVRLEAAHNLLCHLNSQPAMARSAPSVLTTYAALVWLINGLHNRPPSDQAGRAVSRIALPLTVDLDHNDRLMYGFEAVPEDPEDAVPFCPGGMMFFRTMTFPPWSNVARLCRLRDRMLPGNIFKHMFKKTMEDLQLQLNPVLRVQHRRPWPAKRYKVTRGLTLHHTVMPGEEVPMPEAFTRLQDIAMPRRHIEWGPDVEQFHQALEEECNT